MKILNINVRVPTWKWTVSKAKIDFLRDGLTGVGELVDGSLELSLGLPIM